MCVESSNGRWRDQESGPIPQSADQLESGPIPQSVDQSEAVEAAVGASNGLAQHSRDNVAKHATISYGIISIFGCIGNSCLRISPPSYVFCLTPCSKLPLPYAPPPLLCIDKDAGGWELRHAASFIGQVSPIFQHFTPPPPASSLASRTVAFCYPATEIL